MPKSRVRPKAKMKKTGAAPHVRRVVKPVQERDDELDGFLVARGWRSWRTEPDVGMPMDMWDWEPSFPGDVEDDLTDEGRTTIHISGGQYVVAFASFTSDEIEEIAFPDREVLIAEVERLEAYRAGDEFLRTSAE
jgi:hypothetical protein